MGVITGWCPGRGEGGGETIDGGGGKHIAAQIRHTLRLCPGKINVDGVEAGEHHHRSAGPGDRHIQAFLATGSGDRPEVEWQRTARRLFRKRHGEQDRVPLVALHIFQVFHEERVGFLVEFLVDERIIAGLQQVQDEVALLGVEGDHAQGFLRRDGVIEAFADFGDDGVRFHLVGAVQASRLPVELAVDSFQAHAGGNMAAGGGEASEFPLVVAFVGKRDQRLVLGTVMPGQPQLWQAGFDGLRED